MDPIVVTLDYPFEYKGETIQSIAVKRRPKVRDQLAAAKSGKDSAGQEIALLANLAEVAPDILHEVDMADYAKLQQVLMDFLS